MSKTDLDAETLRTLLHYDPETGEFVRIGHFNGRGGGKLGALNLKPHKTGHINIKIGPYGYKAHRLAWLYVYGVWPSKLIDHYDGNPANNRIANLRDTSYQVNAQNRRATREKNASGYLGVQKASNGKYYASIHIGTFVTPEEAHDAYISAKRVLHAGNTL